MDEQLASRIGKRAREARNRLGLTQAEVAEDVEVAEEVYGRLERGGMLPSVPTLVRLCSVLKVEPNDLLRATRAQQGEPTMSSEAARVVRMVERAEPSMRKRVLTVLQAMLGDESPSSAKSTKASNPRSSKSKP